MRDFRGLAVWRRSHELAVAIRRASRALKGSDVASLRSQMIRAAESIPANIVEGCYASTQREFARFLDISIKSSGELEYHLQLAGDYGVIGQRALEPLVREIVDVRKMLVGLRRRIVSTPSSPPQADH